MPAMTAPAIVPKNIAMRNGIERRNRLCIDCSPGTVS
jgi:hypothetical protein